MLLGRRLALVAALTVVPATLVALAACSNDDPASGTNDAGDSDVGPATPRPPAPVAREDDAGDAAVKPPPVLPGCVGTSVTMIPSGERTYVNATLGDTPGAFQGDFLLDFGANASTIDLKAFPAPGPTPMDCAGDAAAPGAQCSFANFDFFGSWGTVSLYTGDYSFLFNSVKQAGIIGTDLLSVFPFTLDYYGKKIWRSMPGAFCTDAQLVAAGFVPIPTGGFYTKDFSKLRPLHDVITDTDADISHYSVPNVPTVPITIAGVAALAQLDTGYDDRIYRHSINVNEALFEQLKASNPTAFQRARQNDLYLTTCIAGLSQAGRAYELQAGTEVNFLTADGSIGRHDMGLMLFVKERLAEAEPCGGIETWSVPAAQMGASFLVDAQEVILDPVQSKIWLPKD